MGLVNEQNWVCRFSQSNNLLISVPLAFNTIADPLGFRANLLLLASLCPFLPSFGLMKVFFSSFSLCCFVHIFIAVNVYLSDYMHLTFRIYSNFLLLRLAGQ